MSFRSCGPAPFDRIRTSVDGNDVVLFRIIVVDHALSIDGRILHLPDKVDRGDHGLFFRIDHRRVMAIAVEGVDVFGNGLIDDGVRVRLPRGYFARHLQRLQIEDNDLLNRGARPAVAIRDKPLAEVFGDGDAVTTRQSSDLAYYGIIVGVEANDFRPIRTDT